MSGMTTPLQLVDFVKRVVRASWEGGSLDGGDIQEMAVECGILTETVFDPEKDDDPHGYAEAGDPWFIFSDAFATLQRVVPNHDPYSESRTAEDAVTD